jgi:hypothetical protein
MPPITDYHRDVRIQPDATPYDIKIDKLTVTAENYAGGKGIATELFDGSTINRSFGWRVRVKFDWDEMTPADHDLLDTIILAIISQTNTNIDFDPVNDPGVKVLTMVLEDVDSALALTFDGGARARSASLSFIVEDVQAAPPVWLTQ